MYKEKVDVRLYFMLKFCNNTIIVNIKIIKYPTVININQTT